VGEVQVGWIWSISMPVRRICVNCANDMPPSGKPSLLGVRLRETMPGPR
jgi:hypothetical protein